METEGSSNTFITAHYLPLFWARSIQYISPHPTSWRSRRMRLIPRLLWIFRNINNFLRWEVVSTSPNPQAGGPSHVGCPRLLIQCIRSYPPYLEAVSPSATWGRAMPWWQRPGYHGAKPTDVRKPENLPFTNEQQVLQDNPEILNKVLNNWKLQQTSEAESWLLTSQIVTWIHATFRRQWQPRRQTLRYLPQRKCVGRHGENVWMWHELF